MRARAAWGWIMLACLAAASTRGASEDASWGETPLRVLWRKDLGRAIEFPPVWNGELLIVATTDPRVIACDAETGERRWVHKSRDAVTAPPAASSSRVFLAISRGGGELRALDATTGEACWTAPSGGSLRQVVAGESLLWTLGQDGVLACRGTSDGARLWSRAGLGWDPPDCTRDGDQVYALARTDSVFALRADDGALLWAAVAPGRGGGAPLAGGGEVHVVRGDGASYRLDAATGTLLGVGRRDALQFASPLASRAGPVTVSTAGRVEAGATWSLDLEAVPAGPPCLAGSLLFILTRSGRLFAVPVTRGQVAWSLDLRTAFFVPPVREGRRLVLAGAKGDLFVYAPDL